MFYTTLFSITQSRPADKDLWVLMDKKLYTSQQCLLAAQNTNCILHQKRHGQQGGEGDCPLPLYPCKAPSGVLHPCLGPTAQEGCRTVGDDQRSGASFLSIKLETAELLQPGEKNVPGRFTEAYYSVLCDFCDS